MPHFAKAEEVSRVMLGVNGGVGVGSGCCPGQIQEEVAIRGLQLVQRLPPVWHHGRCQQWAAARLLFPEIFCGKQW